MIWTDMCQCIPRCGLLIAHQVSLYIWIHTYYTNSHFSYWILESNLYIPINWHELSKETIVCYGCPYSKWTNTSRQFGHNTFWAIVGFSCYLSVCISTFVFFRSLFYNQIVLTDNDKRSTDHLRLSLKLKVILSSQQLCFVLFMVCGWLSRRIFSLCLKTVIVERFMVSWFSDV